MEHYNYMPLYAKIAIERLDADSALRTKAMLTELLDCYAQSYGLTVDVYIRASAEHICSRRFGETFA